MKRTFLSRRNALLSSSGSLWGVLVLCIVGMALLARLIAPGFFLANIAPVLHLGDSVTAGIHDVFAGFSSSASLAVRNEQLSEQNAALALENRTLAQKSADLTALLGTGSSDHQGIVAGVLARPPVAAYDTLILSSGSEDGVMEGQEAFGPGGVPVGVVKGVTTSFSRVALFSSPRESIDAWVGSSHTPITLIGEGGGTFSATAPRSTDIKPGDSVSVAGPGAIPIGTVLKLEGDPSSPSLYVRIEPFINPYTLSWVTLKETGVTMFAASSTLPL